MAKFIYQMQNILNIKTKIESQEKIAYANAQHKLNEEESKLLAIEERKKHYEDQLRNEMMEKIDIKEINSCNQGIEFTKEAMKMQKIEVNTAQKDLNIAQGRLNQAVVERKTHEKLRENAFERFMLEVKEQESKEIDELVSYKFASMI